MDRSEMLRLFEAHRDAEAARDIDAGLETFVEDCFLETMRSSCFDLATLCEQARLPVDEVRRAAAARPEAARSR
jgi:hypothetical protein